MLGVNFAGATAFLAVVREPEEVVADSLPKLEPAVNVGEWQQLLQFGERVRDEAKQVNAVCVAFAEPRRYNQWSWSDAYTRIALQVAAGMALDAGGIEVRRVAQKTAAKTLGMKDTDLSTDLAACLGIVKVPKYWTNRVPAVAVAWHVAQELFQ